MIGVFDSGLGGLSVLAAIAKALPAHDLIYLADSAHLPYGNKSDAFIRQRVLKIGQHLAELGCGLIVVACNTATAAAVCKLREALPGVPIAGIEPGVKPAAVASITRRIAVLATESTARSQRLAQLIRQHASAIHVDVLPCPGWATKVESLQLADPAFTANARRQLSAVLEAGADQIVLGCTHYAFLAPLLLPILEGRAALVDVADAVARQCVRLTRGCATGAGNITLLATAHPERLQQALPVLGLHQIERQMTKPASLAVARLAEINGSLRELQPTIGLA